MKFWTDGSRIGLHKGAPIIGWGAVCDIGVVALGARVGGSNINAEMMAIADLLKRLIAYRLKLIEKESVIHIITDWPLKPPFSCVPLIFFSVCR